VDITVYLPDELGERAKREGINLSRMLRDEITASFERTDAMASTLEGTTTYEREIEDKNGYSYTGRITGKLIAEDNDTEVFLTDDERVIAYDCRKADYYEIADPESELRGMRDEAYLEAMRALGIGIVRDL